MPAIQETWVQSLGWKDTLKEGMATHSSILAWRIPMDVAGEEHGRLQSTESDTAEQLSTAQHRFTLFRPVTFATTHPMVSYLKRVLIKKPSPLFSPFYLDVGGLGCGGGEGPASTHGGGRGIGTWAPSGDQRKKTGQRGQAPRNTSAGSHRHPHARAVPRRLGPKISRRANTYPTQTLPENCRGR